jgi:hypothetical protein
VVDQLFEQLMVPQVMIVAFCVGGVTEAFKRAFKYTGSGVLSKTVLALAPIPLGAALGTGIIPEGGAADPWALGVVAGLISGSAYSAISPAIKAWAGRRVNKTDS